MPSLNRHTRKLLLKEIKLIIVLKEQQLVEIVFSAYSLAVLYMLPYFNRWPHYPQQNLWGSAMLRGVYGRRWGNCHFPIRYTLVRRGTFLMLKICVLYDVFKLYGLFSCTCNLVCGFYTTGVQCIWFWERWLPFVCCSVWQILMFQYYNGNIYVLRSLLFITVFTRISAAPE